MELFIGNISANTRKHEIQKFLGSYGEQAEISLRKLKFDSSIYYYAHVDIESDKLALKVIKKLHGKRLNGKPALIREFQYRAGNNDRRCLNWRNVLWNKIERRLTERRLRSHLLKKNEPEFISYGQTAIKAKTLAV